MEMCSKGVPVIEEVELQRRYPYDSEKSLKTKSQVQDEYPPECGPSLFW